MGVAEVSLAEICDLSGELSHGDWSVVHDRVDDGSFDVRLVDLLSSVVVLNALSLPLNDRLNLLNDMLVDVLSDDRSIDRGRVSLITDGLLVLEGTLGAVLGGVVLGDILSNVTLDLGSDVLVVSVDLLVVYYRLDLLVDFGLLSLTVDDWGDLVVSVLEDILVKDSIFDFSSVSSTDLVVYRVFRWFSQSKSCRSVVLAVDVLFVQSISLLLVSQSSENFVDDGHC